MSLWADILQDLSEFGRFIWGVIHTAAILAMLIPVVIGMAFL